MELDELKATWQALDRRLARHDRINLQLLREGKLDKTRKSLRPLFWGQMAQLFVIGVPLVLLAACLWMRPGSLPLPVSTLLAGIIVHVYGVAAIALAGCTIGLIRTIDYSRPVIEIQKQLARLRRFYVVNSMVIGLPWWFLWVPLLMVLAGLGGVELLAKASSVVWIGLGIGALGLSATWVFSRWSRNPRRPRLARAVEDSVSGASLRNARRTLDEIMQFEKE